MGREPSISIPRPPPVKRVSNACLQCRSRHMRCDSATPVCSRCRQEKTDCVYMKSRRGGVRRKGVVGQQPPLPAPGSQQASASQPAIEQTPDHGTGTYRLPHSLDLDPPRVVDTQANEALEVEGGLLSLYYTFFHAAHPCALPQWSLRLRVALHPASLEVLLPVLQFIGSLYSPSVPSAALERQVLRVLDGIRSRGRTVMSPFEIQAVVLYAIVVYWRDEIDRSLNLLDEAIRNAVQIGMHREGFAERHGEGDPVLEESWRRTWWQIYLAASHMSGSTHVFPSKVEGIVMTVGLPCEEECYEAGNIPQLRTLHEYDTREFQPPTDPGFSSFAELIGLARSLDLVLSERNQDGSDITKRVCANADTSILAWLLLLPPRKQALVRDNGAVDEQIFRAHMLIYAYTVDLNRELSELLYNSIESVCRRSPRPPQLGQTIRWSPFDAKTKTHTIKVLAAIEKMNGLLTLPTHLGLHTPFIICMIANTAIAHLSAYKWVYPGPRLRIERERIRMIVGVLKMLSEYWPLGKRTYREIATIARHVLQIDEEDVAEPGGVAQGDLQESICDFLQVVEAFTLVETGTEVLAA